MYETLITQYGGPVYFRAQMAADAGIDPMLFDALWIPSENDRTIGKQTLEETIEQILRQTGKYSEETFQTIISGRKADSISLIFHILRSWNVPPFAIIVAKLSLKFFYQLYDLINDGISGFR